mmetsp:Transcript_85438/g.242217  ORF Transcript_85438/g.242217 Transcript_85438/m.242217 type:complete len:670 (+) Transcript_85438:105-2114(+)
MTAGDEQHEEQPQEAAARQQQQQQPAEAAASQEQGIGQYFRWRPLPWWICFLGGIFLLTKLQVVYNDSPCAVLGTQSPVNMSDIKRAFRTLSMCTHPDRLRGRLKRDPTPQEQRRGEIIFNRASAAKDELQKVLKGSKKKVKCYQGELEMAVLEVLAELGKGLTRLGITDYTSMVMDLGYNLVTFRAGFFNTMLSFLWVAFLFRIVKQFFMYLWRMGIIRGTVAIVTTVIIGPLPTVVHFVGLPFIRIQVFIQESIASLKGEEAALPPPAEDAPADASPATGTTATMAAAKANSRELPARNIRQRKKKETPEEKERKSKELLTGTEAPAVGLEGAQAAVTLPEGIWKRVALTHKEPVKARQAAATAVQFDLLLILTKPVIPLFMLVAVGQVWNGLFPSLIIGHVLRRWVPQMSYEAHHLLVSFFGVAHTLLGVSAGQVEDIANSAGGKVLHLAWHWSFKDVLAVMHMCMLGSMVAAMSALGNEPSFGASFAAGIALRIACAQDSIRGLGFTKVWADTIEVNLRDLGVVLDKSEEVVAYSGNGIGDCGGGPFRMLFGEATARWAALALKAWLLLIPLLATLQWLQRTIHAGRNLGKRFKTARFVQRVVLFLLGLSHCVMIAKMELNASNGALGNFWVAMLFGCAGESLLSTYDVRGPVRQILFLLLFLLI